MRPPIVLSRSVALFRKNQGAIMSLRSLANTAAIELDNCLLGRSSGFGAVRELVKLIRYPAAPTQTSPAQSVAGQPLSSYSTAIVIHRAISFSNWKPSHALTKIDGVLAESSHIADRLEKVANNAELRDEPAKNEVRMLRSLCLGLSKSAMAAEPVFEGARGELLIRG